MIEMVPDFVIEIVHDCVRKKIQRDASRIPDSATFESLGLDSMDLVELLADIEAELHLNFNERDIDQFRTMRDLREVTRRKYDTDKSRRAQRNRLR